MIIGFIDPVIALNIESPTIFKTKKYSHMLLIVDKVYDLENKEWIKNKGKPLPIPSDEEVFMWLLEAEEI